MLCGIEVVCELAAPMMRTHRGGAGCMERKVEDRRGLWRPFLSPAPQHRRRQPPHPIAFQVALLEGFSPETD